MCSNMFYGLIECSSAVTLPMMSFPLVLRRVAMKGRTCATDIKVP